MNNDKKEWLRVDYTKAARRIVPNAYEPRTSSTAVMCYGLALILAIIAVTLEFLK